MDIVYKVKYEFSNKLDNYVTPLMSIKEAYGRYALFDIEYNYSIEILHGDEVIASSSDGISRIIDHACNQLELI